MLGLVLLLPVLATASEEPSSLRTRLEAHLEAHRAALARSPGHYGLLFPIEEMRLRQALAPVIVHTIDGEPVLGSVSQPEPHGGGLLALLLEHWRPEGRAATMDDRFDFGAGRGQVRLGDLYAAQRRQLFLPAAGEHGPSLPRMREHFPENGPVVELDAYRFLATLLAHEPDLEATWQNAAGEALSVDAAFGAVRAVYFETAYLDRTEADHGHFHLVSLLLAWHGRAPERVDLDRVRRRFLEVELDDSRIAQASTEALGHSVEALGRLVGESAVTWSDIDRRHVDAWLARLEEERFRRLDGIPLQHLSHLLWGLRALDAAGFDRSRD